MPGADAVRLEALLMPKQHARANLREAFHRSAELCAACDRKNWNLPQNETRWMPGPDEDPGVAEQPFLRGVPLCGGNADSGEDVRGVPQPARRRAEQTGSQGPEIELDAFVRRVTGRQVEPFETGLRPHPQPLSIQQQWRGEPVGVGNRDRRAHPASSHTPRLKGSEATGELGTVIWMSWSGTQGSGTTSPPGCRA